VSLGAERASAASAGKTESGNMGIQCIKKTEQGVEFFVVLVKEEAIEEPARANQTVAMFQKHLQRPVVLCGDLSGNYFGRKDLANFLAQTLSFSQIHWQRLDLQPS
jgi:hypothetical protein